MVYQDVALCFLNGTKFTASDLDVNKIYWEVANYGHADKDLPQRTALCFCQVGLTLDILIISENSQKGNLLSIIVPIALISIIILVAASFVLYRRKKLYGGFYLFSYPPLPDYMAILDKNGNIQDQLQKLPFIPEWEFPRERITLGK